MYSAGAVWIRVGEEMARELLPAPATFVHDSSHGAVLYQWLAQPAAAPASQPITHDILALKALIYCKPDLTTMVQQAGVLQERLQRRVLAVYTPAFFERTDYIKACNSPLRNPL